MDIGKKGEYKRKFLRDKKGNIAIVEKSWTVWMQFCPVSRYLES